MSCKKNCSKIFCSDLDGTLVKGDITEGSIYYKGIVEHLYSLGLVNSIKYPTYADYSLVYFRRVELEDTGAYVMPYEIYDSNTQDNAIAQYWKNTISKFFVNYTSCYSISRKWTIPNPCKMV